MEIYSAPLQGFTEAVWRNIHEEVFGGIDTYFTPFIRFEHNEIRSKDIREVEKKNNSVRSLVPQIIAATPQEMQPLLQLIKSEGYCRVDINMGCSFPLQARRCHGAGILPHPQLVAALMDEVARHPDVEFSVKMRLGWENKDEWKALIDILNAAPLKYVTMHPRLGCEQYRQPADPDAFAEFYNACAHPVVYNGDIKDVNGILRLEEQFPRIQAVMVGRGLLENPALGREYREGTTLPHEEKRELVRAMHERFLCVMSQRLQGNTQLLSKLKPYWEYLLPDLEKKYRKAILKSTTAEKYISAVNTALSVY